MELEDAYEAYEGACEEDTTAGRGASCGDIAGRSKVATGPVNQYDNLRTRSNICSPNHKVAAIPVEAFAEDRSADLASVQAEVQVRQVAAEVAEDGPLGEAAVRQSSESQSGRFQAALAADRRATAYGSVQAHHWHPVHSDPESHR